MDFAGRLMALRPFLMRVLVVAGVATVCAEDIVQDTLVDLVSREQQLGMLTDAELRSYARCAALGFASKYFRGEHRRSRREAAWGLTMAPWPQNAVEHIERHRAFAELYVRLLALPASLAASVFLCDLEGKTCEEAAAELRIPTGTIKTRLRKARLVLRQGLDRGQVKG